MPVMQISRNMPIHNAGDADIMKHAHSSQCDLMLYTRIYRCYNIYHIVFFLLQTPPLTCPPTPRGPPVTGTPPHLPPPHPASAAEC